MESTELTQRLPEDVLVAVLRRLPPHGLAAARCVCKTWYAVIDTLRLLDLFPPSLAGLFIHFFDLEISEYFFRPLRATYTAVSGRLDYAPTENSDTGIIDHCNGLLLFCTYVAPHYEVLNIPMLPRRTFGFEPQHEWPPSPFVMHVFSSTTGDWEERSFVRRGNAVGTISRPICSSERRGPFCKTTLPTGVGNFMCSTSLL